MVRVRSVLVLSIATLALVVSACTQPGGGGGPANQPPIAVPTASPSSGPPALNVAFDGSTSVDNDGTITGYSWDFGDPASGVNNTSTLVNPSHVYASPGSYVATLTVTDNLGATGSATQPISVSNPVSVTVPADGSQSNNATPTFSGTASGNAGDAATLTVDVKQGVTVVQSLTATRSGTAWSVPASGALADGAYTVEATQSLDLGGSATSPAINFTIDTTAPTGLSVTAPANGSTSNVNTPTFTGTAGNALTDDLFPTVVVKQGVTTVQSLAATRTGTTWSVPASGALADGTYTVAITQGDVAGNSTTSAANTFTVDTTAPSGVAVTSPADNSQVANGSVTFSGTAGNAAGDSSSVTVTVKQGVTTIQTQNATRSGTSWSVAASPALSPGVYTVTATQTDASGNSTTSAANTFTVLLPELVYTGTADKNVGCFSGLGGDDSWDLTLGGDGWWSFSFQGCTAFATETVALWDRSPHVGNDFQSPTGYECRMEIDGTSDVTGYNTANLPGGDLGGHIFLSSGSAWPTNTNWTIRCRDAVL